MELGMFATIWKYCAAMCKSLRLYILDNNVVIFAHVDWSGLLHKLMQNLACRLVHGHTAGCDTISSHIYLLER